MLKSIFFVLPFLGLATAVPQPLDTASLERRDNPVAVCNNGGTPLCCQGTFAGDLPIIRTLAGLTAFPLNPNDVNCIGVLGPASTSCVGVNTCCQVTSPTSPLLALYCQKPANC